MGAFTIDRFLNIRSASGPTFSPDGRFLAFLTTTTGLSQAWQIPVTGGWPTQLTFLNDSVRGLQYHPTRHQLLFSADKGGNERTQLYLLKGVGNSDHGLGDGELESQKCQQEPGRELEPGTNEAALDCEE